MSEAKKQGRLEGKVALITGASRGVGLANAKLMVAEGATVIMTDLNSDDGIPAAAALGALFIKQDVSSEADWQAVIEEIKQTFGALHILVNNAAILVMRDIEQETLAGWQKIQRVNQDSVFLGMKYALPLLEASGGGSIVNMSSSSAVQGMPNFIAYSASKAAVRGLTQTMAVYCQQKANGIRCNSIHPDGINTQMVAELKDIPEDALTTANITRAISYMSEASDIAEIVLFLASDAAISINGAEIRADKAASYTPPYI